jgi:choline dehydrogenase
METEMKLVDLSTRSHRQVRRPGRRSEMSEPDVAMPRRKSYDYIIVGGGTAGSVVAARLSEDPRRNILVLEAGSSQPLQAMAVPALWRNLLGSSADWSDPGAINAFTGTQIATPRGRGLGGSSSINGLNFVRGYYSCYDAWAQAGATGWGFADLLPYFQRCETAPGRDPDVRGQNGPLIVSPPPSRNPLIAAAVCAAIDAGFRRAIDLSSGLETGFGWPDTNIVNGHRQSAAEAYLAPVGERINLEILSDTLVRRLLLDGSRCIGVEFQTSTGVHTARSSREVVLTAGAIGSAQLLLLSGIGDATHLREVGIEPLVELPGVGRNLQDHPLATLTYSARGPIPADPKSPPGEGMGLLRIDSANPWPDLQFIFSNIPIPVVSRPQPLHGYTIVFSGTAPHSRGRVTLADPDPCTSPVVDPNYLGDQRDIAIMHEGLKFARGIGEQAALDSWRAEEIHPGPGVANRDSAALNDYLRHALRPFYHYAGTCKIGTDPMSVVNPELQVHELTGLCVADASVMPTIVPANTIATVYAIAEKAVDLIKSRTAPALVA